MEISRIANNQQNTISPYRHPILIPKTRLFKYNENITTKTNKIFQLKNSDIFHISAQNIDWGYSLEPPRRGGSNEYPQSMFEQKYEKISEFLISKFSVFGGEIFFIF